MSHRAGRRAIRAAAALLLAVRLAGAGTGPPLEPAAPREGTIAGGEALRYSLQLSSGSYVRLALDQDGTDLELRLEAPDGKLLASADSPFGAWGTERLSWLGGDGGDLAVVVLSRGPVGTPGRFRLRIEELRAPEPSDPERLAAERQAGEALRLYTSREGASLRNALSLYEELARRWAALGDGGEEAASLYMAGNIRRLLGEAREAVPLFDRALALWRAAGDRRRQASALNQRGLAQWALADRPGALASYQEALDLWRELGDTAAEARTLSNLGLVHQAAGDPRAAQEVFGRALGLLRAAGNPAGEATVLNNLGSVHDLLGEPDQALDSYGRSLEIFRSLEQLAGEAEARNNLGLVHDLVGEPQIALEQYRQALDLFRQLGDRRREAAVLYNLAGVYDGLGERDRTHQFLDQALLLQKEIGDRRGEAGTLAFLGRLKAVTGEGAEALSFLERALRLDREIGDRRGEAVALVSLGALESRLGRRIEAGRHLDEALSLLREIGDRRSEAESLHLLGSLQAAAGDAGAARKLLAQALELRRKVEDPDGEARMLQEIARLDLAAGELAAARGTLEEALDRIESLRARVVRRDLRDTFFADRQDAYELLVEVLLRLHRAEPAAGHQVAALEAAERGRARGLLDLLHEARADLRQGIAPELADRLQRAHRLRDAKAGRHARLLAEGAPAAAVEEARAELEAAFEDLAASEAAARAASPRYAGLTRGAEVRFSELRSHDLNGGTMLLEYALGRERSWLWAVTPETVDVYELPPREEIEAAARSVAEGLRRRSTGEAEERSLAALARTLLGPVANRLPQRVLVVPDGALHYIPFAALPLPDGSPLVAEHEVVHLPSAATLAALRQKARTVEERGAVAVFADPVFTLDDPRVGRAHSGAGAGAGAAPRERAGEEPGRFERLPWTRREAEAILAQAAEAGRPVLAALDFDADLRTATSPELRRYRIVHFATHGVLDSRRPALSGLVLSLVQRDGTPRDGFLRLSELYGLDLDADLVVLSGCETALGREMRGEGLTGLTRGFFYAGTSRVVASLWRVEDRATAELMTRFYRALLAEGRRPADALRAAQLSMWRDKRWRDPYFWAAFTIQGDWQ